MKKFLALLTVIFAALIPAIDTFATSFTNLYNFSSDSYVTTPSLEFTNADGINPAGCIVSGNTIYGIAESGGIYGFGTLFRMNTDGTHFTNLFNFNRGTYNSTSQTYPGTTGVTPDPGLVLIGNTLYGTTHSGGDVLAGSVFRINTDGSGFATIHEFNYSDGQNPQHGLVQYGNLLYGSTVLGGTYGWGNIFTIDPGNDSIGFVYQFTNNVEPYGGVVVVSNNIYGFGRWGESTDGLVYKIGAGGYSVLYTFNGTNGANPECTPVLSGNTLFGVTFAGGIYGNGNVFRVDLDGSNFTNLYSFTPNGGANRDGTNPYDWIGLVLAGNTLYGAASLSGSGGQGTIFQLNTDGSGFKVLHSFSFSDGGMPDDVVLSAGTLYGGTFQGGSNGVGTLFAITLQPTLNLTNATNRAVLTWSDPSFSLYSSANVNGTFTNVVGASSPYTNSFSGSQRFFRLQSN